MGMDEEDRKFQIEVEKIRMEYNFAKTGFMLLLSMFFISAFFIKMTKDGLAITPILVVGLFITVLGLLIIPRYIKTELDRLR